MELELHMSFANI